MGNARVDTRPHKTHFAEEIVFIQLHNKNAKMTFEYMFDK